MLLDRNNGRVCPSRKICAGRVCDVGLGLLLHGRALFFFGFLIFFLLLRGIVGGSFKRCLGLGFRFGSTQALSRCAFVHFGGDCHLCFGLGIPLPGDCRRSLGGRLFLGGLLLEHLCGGCRPCIGLRLLLHGGTPGGHKHFLRVRTFRGGLLNHLCGGCLPHIGQGPVSGNSGYGFLVGHLCRNCRPSIGPVLGSRRPSACRPIAPAVGDAPATPSAGHRCPATWAIVRHRFGVLMRSNVRWAYLWRMFLAPQEAERL
mmetsp:Transcript_87902/g.246913  ORF Transcript_87902/g.246913 Transcript_87902/m.246913 type:complete len:258 (+) Transcript_87902:461-1234(+)